MLQLVINKLKKDINLRQKLYYSAELKLDKLLFEMDMGKVDSQVIC